MKKRKSIISNYFYNLTYQLFTILMPIIVTPYISRVLTDIGSGQYSYAYSINSYFTLIAALGFNYYGQRQIAKNQDDIKKQSIDFWSIFTIRLVSSLLSLILYFILSLTGSFGEKYTFLLEIMSINIIATIFDITFFFNGNEEFKKIVVRNVFIKILSVICVFIFVKDVNDLWIYTLIQSLSLILGNLSLWLYLPNYLMRVKINELRIIKHIKPALILFLPTIATSIYTSLDKTLIGAITKSDSENGNYEYADRIIKMVLTVITSLGTVLIPRNSKRFSEGDMEGVKNNIYLSCQFVFFVGVPAMFGMIAIVDNFVPWFLGPGYDKVAVLIKILSPLFLIIGISNVLGLQYLIPSSQDKKFTICLICGALSNFALNIVMIIFWQAIGAAIATIIAETIVTGLMLFFVRKDINFAKILIKCWKYIISGIIMFIPCFFITKLFTSYSLSIFITVAIGVCVYFISLIILKDSFLNKIFIFIKKKLKKDK